MSHRPSESHHTFRVPRNRSRVMRKNPCGVFPRRPCAHLGEGGTTSRVVDNVGDNALDVPMALGEVLRSEGREVGGSVRGHFHRLFSRITLYIYVRGERKKTKGDPKSFAGPDPGLVWTCDLASSRRASFASSSRRIEHASIPRVVRWHRNPTPGAITTRLPSRRNSTPVRPSSRNRVACSSRVSPARAAEPSD